MLAWLYREMIPSRAVTACVETVEVLRADEFAPSAAQTSSRFRFNSDPQRSDDESVGIGAPNEI